VVSVETLRTVRPRRVCVIKPSALGDIVQSLPLVEALKKRFPGCTVSWVANREYVGLLERHPLLDEVLPFGRRDAWDTVAAWARLIGLLRQLRRGRFDLVLDLQGLARTGVMALATDAPIRLGLQTAREGSHLACHLLLPGTSTTVPAHLRYRRVAEALGATEFPDRVPLRLDADDRLWADRVYRELGAPVLAVHPGARWMSKRWPAEKFASVAAKAARRLGASVVLVGGWSDVRTAAEVERLLRQFVPHVRLRNVAGQTTLPRLAALLQRVDTLLCNDSGPMHLAAALGTPVVAVFTCTRAERSGPPGPEHQLVQAPTPCAGSYRKRCPLRGRKHLLCMEQLTTDEVFRAVQRVLERRAQRRAA